MTHRRRDPPDLREQARRMIWKHQAVGLSRRTEMERLRSLGLAIRGTMSTGRIHSQATLSRYTGCWARIGEWAREQYGIHWMNQILPAHVEQFVREQAAAGASQKTINNYVTAARFGIATATQRSFHDVHIDKPKGKGPSQRPRAYSSKQVARICRRQSTRHALATRIVATTGIRAEELWTLHRVTEPARLAAWQARTQPDDSLPGGLRLPRQKNLDQTIGTLMGRFGGGRSLPLSHSHMQDQPLIFGGRGNMGQPNLLDRIIDRPVPGDRVKAVRNMQNSFERMLQGLRAKRAAAVAERERQFYGRAARGGQPFPQPEKLAGQSRRFHPQRFAGLEGGALYQVTGKGGLVREIIIPADLAAALEAYQLNAPRVVYDRDGRYCVEYDLPGGRQWARSFSRASQLELGFSTGGHGLRHGYVQDRFRYYLAAGYSDRDAKAIVASEVGHFRPHVTNVYRR